MASQPAVVPFDEQPDSRTMRMCGAACLRMVYRSFGKEIPQDQIFAAIAKPTASGSLAARTHLMARDAVNRGFHALAMQSRHPLHVLRLCRELGIRAILNHSVERGSPAGHYSVLVDLDDKNVVLHDPFFGPSRRLSHGELLDLWLPHAPNSEILGNVVIGIANGLPALPECEFCHTPMPSVVDCPKCKKPVGLTPGALLGCMRDGCIARMWNYLCCPACDGMWTFSLQPGDDSNVASFSRPESSAPQAVADPWQLDRLFAELDRFCAFVGALPVALARPEIKQQLDFIASSKERLKLAQAEEFARLQARHDKLDAQIEAAKQRREERRKQIEERNRPLPPLDGNALGRALLKNLGLTT